LKDLFPLLANCTNAADYSTYYEELITILGSSRGGKSFKAYFDKNWNDPEMLKLWVSYLIPPNLVGNLTNNRLESFYGKLKAIVSRNFKAIASCETFELFIYDSMGANKLHKLVKKNLVLFLESLKEGKWVKKRLISNPSQEDGGSCGVFICAFIHAFLETKNLHGQEMLWSQKNIPFFRMFMLNRILNMSNNNE
jgi:hypothetical protein